MSTLKSIQPQEVFSFFESLSGIPRGSGNEKEVADWVIGFARDRGLEAVQDEMHCVLVKKPGQHGLEDAPPLILHGHLDMVCEKDEGVVHDFERDPIELRIEGDFITADGTSLGADNGIGVSYILALLDSRDLPHPPLEAVLTAMEEKGKVGAAQFDTGRLSGKRMIDFNWITEKEILAGCSGDVTFTVDIPAEWEPVPDTHSGARLLKVRGLAGGHCEFDIHLERANAVLVLARALNALHSRYDVRIAAPHGGAQNNAIPADAQALVLLRPEDAAGAAALVAELEQTLRREYSISDPGLRLELDSAETPPRAFSAQAGTRFARLTSLVPNGVLSWSLGVPGIVESSNNLGTVRTTPEGARLMSTITAAVTSRKHEILDRVRSLAALAGGGIAVEQYGLDAPEFPYHPGSPLLEVAREAFRDALGEEPDVHVSQCSLELGMFSQKVPGLDIISIGTELHDLHSPKESVNHTSVARVWPLVRTIVGRLR
ncbi:beta-Ala-His dipeptidase [Sinomonas terrae]|uniref:Beta-Ala-His dipeptidase n=1 Tax=Sinomonas terrae TaxID=2908838 RepID=A0ABS9U7D9_9MICC|nr:beta-Ala-His dipeptidase [Sinomonas terrae]MCH6472610.1 beta-Ala-His dipeptidase [Sinomonas terrae]